MIDLRFGLGFLVLAAGAYFDLLHRQNIPTWLLYGALGAAIGINLAQLQPVLIIASLTAGGAVWLLFHNVHRLGLIGGAEPDLFAFLAMLLPLNFGVALFLISLWMLAMLARRRFKPEKTKVPLIPYLLLAWLLSGLLLE